MADVPCLADKIEFLVTRVVSVPSRGVLVIPVVLSYGPVGSRTRFSKEKSAHAWHMYEYKRQFSSS